MVLLMGKVLVLGEFKGVSSRHVRVSFQEEAMSQLNEEWRVSQVEEETGKHSHSRGTAGGPESRYAYTAVSSLLQASKGRYW